MQDAVAALGILRSISAGNADEFRKQAGVRFPLAKAFKSPEQLDAGLRPRLTGNEDKEMIEE